MCRHSELVNGVCIRCEKEIKPTHTQSEPAKHTPTPWKVRIEKGEIDVLGADGSVIAYIGAHPEPELFAAEKVTAELIVNAVNAFESLTQENAKLKASHQDMLDVLEIIRAELPELDDPHAH